MILDFFHHHQSKPSPRHLRASNSSKKRFPRSWLKTQNDIISTCGSRSRWRQSVQRALIIHVSPPSMSKQTVDLYQNLILSKLDPIWLLQYTLTNGKNTQSGSKIDAAFYLLDLELWQTKYPGSMIYSLGSLYLAVYLGNSSKIVPLRLSSLHAVKLLSQFTEKRRTSFYLCSVWFKQKGMTLKRPIEEYIHMKSIDVRPSRSDCVFEQKNTDQYVTDWICVALRSA